MPSVADTISRLQALQTSPLSEAPSGRLLPLTAFGANPGALDGWSYVPQGGADMALVVVLHGCTQTAAGYDRGAGWSDLAERHGFAVLLPEQRRANNANRCFNWFVEEDTARDHGEALSIRQMIGAMLDRHPIDPARVFVTGLSAGGAMTGVMLATYPELFAGGAIIAGLPYGAAGSVGEALERMRGAGHGDDAAYADRVRRASPHRGPWPRVTVWHGDADATVTPRNAEAVVGQWRLLHGLGEQPDRVERVAGHTRRIWLDRDGREALEDYRISGMGHGTPLKTRGAESSGVAGAHMLEAGLSSTWRQANAWGLLRDLPATAEPEIMSPPPPISAVQATIEGALRSAGLMR